MLKYRPNVGVVVFNKFGKVLMCARADCADMQWQFPQGGIDASEKPINAALRELKEETNISSVDFVAEIPQPLRYDFPPRVLVKQKRKGSLFVGQEQHWFLFYFYGDDNEIDFLAHPQEIEFKAFEWVDISVAPLRIINFKKEVYSKVVQTFAPFIKSKIAD